MVFKLTDSTCANLSQSSNRPNGSALSTLIESSLILVSSNDLSRLAVGAETKQLNLAPLDYKYVQLRHHGTMSLEPVSSIVNLPDSMESHSGIDALDSTTCMYHIRPGAT